jgi:predicted nucleic acid-binding protein
MLHEAHGRSAELVARLKSSPDIDNMSDEAFQEFVQAISVPQFIKDELLRAEKGRRNNLYSDKIGWIELSDAEKAQCDLNNYLLEHRILTSDELASAFREVSKYLAIANVIYRNYKESKLANLFDKSAKCFAKIPPQMEQIGSLIQKRLNYEKA